MKINNPLTIIAIFAGVAESLATIALVNVPQDIQLIFVYFVMVFPTVIVVLFFLTLNYNNTVLYAPSDFDDQSHYLEANKVKEKISANFMKNIDIALHEINEFGPNWTQEDKSKIRSILKNSINL
ncbi:TPA: hypothetical protein PC598_000399 [Morganella morganii]|nr:hypothetical protein [Morganella morganii]